MTIDEVTLRAYVDGELSPDERSRVDSLITHSAQVRKQVEALRASCLPYRAAFEAAPTPPIPQALTQQLAALSAVAQAGSPTGSSRSPTARRRWIGNTAAGLGMAASFAAGFLVRPAWFFSSGDDDAMFGPWVRTIASYQALYVRETVERGVDSPENITKVLQNFRLKLSSIDAAGKSAEQKDHGRKPGRSSVQSDVNVPDLSSAGLAFMRAQLLGYEGRPLIQMAYLPSRGKPAALCILPIGDASEGAVIAKRMENLSIATWQKEGLSYVLAADMPLAEARAIGEKLNAGQYPKLFKSS
jgi:anti-sigma factor RsiW